MTALSKKLRSVQGGGLVFWCPGCKESHVIYHGDGDGPRWGWNGDHERPTFTPSVLVRTGHHVPGWADRLPEGADKSCWCTYSSEHPEDPDPFKCAICHSFVVDGQIQFLDDCTHALAGQTIPLPDHWEAGS